MTSVCGTTTNVGGPFNQTLFLGCSITNFSCNLGWGADQSTLTVSVVEDKCSHPQSNLYGQLDTLFQTLQQQPDDVQGGKAFHKKGDNQYETNDPTKALHKNLAFQLKNAEDERDAENITLPPNEKDYGKICYGVNGILRWTGPDPGFIGASGNKFHPSGYDILGTPVQFRYNDFTFGGIVSSWKQSSSAVSTGLKQGPNGSYVGVIETGSRSFDIEIRSFSSLLNGCQLILSNYAGTMCGVVAGTENNPLNKLLAMPMPYKINRTSPTAPPTFTFLPYNVGIEQGNIPNVFNIYGYLEYQGYKSNIYGNAGVTDQGIRAQFVYDTIKNILGPESMNNPEAKSAFSPYGGIVTRSVKINGLADQVIPQSVNLSNGAGGGSAITLNSMGLAPSVLAIDNRQRPVLKIDISEVPRPPRWLRLQGSVISLMQFISECCDGAGYDFFLDYRVATTQQLQRGISGIIIVRTVSRRKQPRKNQIEMLVDDFLSRGGVENYSKGKEFTDSNTRTMYIGGKQKRLLQLKATALAYKQSTMIWNPFAPGIQGGRFIDYDGTGSSQAITAPNKVREPNPASTRQYSFKYKLGSAAVSESSQFFNQAFFQSATESNPITKGNYFDSVNLAEAQGFIGSYGPMNKEIYKDAICLYFGVGGNNLIRPVFFDKAMGQHQIIFQTADIQGLTSLPLSNYNPYSTAPFTGANPGLASSASSPIFLVLEDEIRAAGNSFSSWLQYNFCADFTTDISELIYKGFRDKYGWGTSAFGNTTFTNYKDMFLSTISEVMTIVNRKTQNVNGQPRQVNLDAASPLAKVLYKDLENIHKFFNNIATTYYGKKYMVRLPELAWYRDLNYILDDDGNKIQLGIDENGNPIYAIEGSGKVFTNVNVSQEGAWEEPGNFIDDMIVVGGATWSVLADETGKIPCVVGFNANAEKDWSRRFFRAADLQQMATFTANNGIWTLFDWEWAVSRIHADEQLNESNHYYSSVSHDLPPDSYGLFWYNSPQLNLQLAHGGTVPNDKRYKLYVKANPDADIQFLGADYSQPRVIVDIPSPVSIGNHGVDLTDTQVDQAIVVASLCKLWRGSTIPPIIQGMVVGANIYSGGTTVLGGLSQRITPWNDGSPANVGLRAWSLSQGIMNLPDAIRTGRDRGYDNPTIMPRAAVPMFCGLPIEYRDFIYGPWINHPGLLRESIFPDSTDTNMLTSEVENLVGGVKVIVDETLTPWNFGGMLALDEAVMLKIADEANYQQIIEMGSVSIPGFDNYRLGDILKLFGADFDGPIINNIQVQIGEGGVKTTYNFRTYQRKLGLYNKENAERIKMLSQEALKRNKEINTKLIQLASKLKAGGGTVVMF